MPEDVQTQLSAALVRAAEAHRGAMEIELEAAGTCEERGEWAAAWTHRAAAERSAALAELCEERARSAA